MVYMNKPPLSNLLSFGCIDTIPIVDVTPDISTVWVDDVSTIGNV